jgi:acetyl/propionyl-CoA carboxylase alpha subunit
LATPALKRPIAATGHAIEVRICSEEPARRFAPSVGTIEYWREPSGPGVRVDSGVARGSVVSPYYDPLLAKLIVHASTRAEAVARLDAALSVFHVIGVETNIAYLLSVIRDEAFRAGDTHVRFLEERLSGWRPSAEIPDEVLLALAASEVRESRDFGNGARPPAVTPRESVWRESGAWRNV